MHCLLDNEPLTWGHENDGLQLSEEEKHEEDKTGIWQASW